MKRDILPVGVKTGNMRARPSWISTQAAKLALQYNQGAMTREPSQRRKIKPAWIIGLLCTAFLALFFYQLFGPNPAIVVSKETTFITAPLGKDGLPDYEAYFMERDSQGVTPENNAAVLIWQAIWPGDLNPEHWLPLCEALGVEAIPSQEQSLGASTRQKCA